MDRRSFLIGLGSTGFVTTNSPERGHSDANPAGDTTVGHEGTYQKRRLLRLAERVIPETDLERLTITTSDLNGAASDYEQYQSNPTGTPFMNWLVESDAAVTPSDVAIAAYALTDEDNAGTFYPHYLDGAAIALPPGETDTVVSAVKGWEDHARDQASQITSTRAVSDNRGLSRELTFTNPDGYRVQRLRILGDRMLVHWVEGVDTDGSAYLPGMVACQVEKEILLRGVRDYLDAGHSMPDEPILLERPRWSQ